MAFVSSSATIFNSPLTLGSTTSVCRRRPQRSASQRFPVCVPTMTSDSTDDEVSVPISSLKDFKEQETNSEPAAPTEPEVDDRTEAQKEIDRLRAAEKFITIDEGNHECMACGYLYEPAKGERQSGIAPGTAFEDLPDSFICPACRSPKKSFVPKKKVIAGFADNQKYGFGSNSLTGGQKNALIFGGLAFFFLLLLSGYALN